MTLNVNSNGRLSGPLISEERIDIILRDIAQKGDHERLRDILTTYSFKSMPYPVLRANPYIARKLSPFMIQGLQERILSPKLVKKVVRVFIQSSVFVAQQGNEEVLFNCRDGQVVKAPKELLALLRPRYFEMFYTTELAKTNSEQVQVDHSAYHVDTVKLLIKYLTTQKLDYFLDVATISILELIVLSEELNEQELKEHCEDSILTKCKYDTIDIKTEEEVLTLLNFLKTNSKQLSKVEEKITRGCLLSLLKSLDLTHATNSETGNLIINARYCNFLKKGENSILRDKMIEFIDGLILPSWCFSDFRLAVLCKSIKLEQINLLIFQGSLASLAQMLTKDLLEIIYQACPRLTTVGIVLHTDEKILSFMESILPLLPTQQESARQINYVFQNQLKIEKYSRQFYSEKMFC